MEYIEFIFKMKKTDVPVALASYGYDPVNSTETPEQFLTRKMVEVPTEKMREYLVTEQARIAQLNTPRPPEIIVEVNE